MMGTCSKTEALWSRVLLIQNIQIDASQPDAYKEFHREVFPREPFVLDRRVA